MTCLGHLLVVCGGAESGGCRRSGPVPPGRPPRAPPEAADRLPRPPGEAPAPCVPGAAHLCHAPGQPARSVTQIVGGLDLVPSCNPPTTCVIGVLKSPTTRNRFFGQPESPTTQDLAPVGAHKPPTTRATDSLRRADASGSGTPASLEGSGPSLRPPCRRRTEVPRRTANDSTDCRWFFGGLVTRICALSVVQGPPARQFRLSVLFKHRQQRLSVVHPGEHRANHRQKNLSPVCQGLGRAPCGYAPRKLPPIAGKAWRSPGRRSCRPPSRPSPTGRDGLSALR